MDSPDPSLPNRAARRAQSRRGRKLAALGSGAALATTGAAATVALTATPAGAATFTVDNLDDSGAGSLRQAVLDANAAGGADEIVFAEGLTGTITVESQIDVTDELTLNGPGASVITISGGGDSRIFQSSAPFAVNNLTLADAGPDTDNCGNDSGGAIRQVAANLEVAASVFTGNSGGYGASVYLGADVTGNISGSTFVANVANDECDGPAVYGSANGNVTITTSTFDRNIAPDEGGAVWLCGNAGANMAITNSTFTRNEATGTAPSGQSVGGGAIIAFQCEQGAGSHLLIANTTVTGNTAVGQGGAILFYSQNADASLTILQSTITDNTAGFYGGGISLYGEPEFPVTITGTILTGNTVTGSAPLAAGEDDEQQVGGAETADVGALAAGPSDLWSEIPELPTGDNNVVGTLEAATTLTGAGNQLGVTDPLLGPLADNGGPTQTRAILDGSPALNNGPDPVPDFPGNEFDQRGDGFLRVVFGRVDVGAYEVQAPVIELTPTFTG